MISIILYGFEVSTGFIEIDEMWNVKIKDQFQNLILTLSAVSTIPFDNKLIYFFSPVWETLCAQKIEFVQNLPICMQQLLLPSPTIPLRKCETGFQVLTRLEWLELIEIVRIGEVSAANVSGNDSAKGDEERLSLSSKSSLDESVSKDSEVNEMEHEVVSSDVGSADAELSSLGQSDFEQDPSVGLTDG